MAPVRRTAEATTARFRNDAEVIAAEQALINQLEWPTGLSDEEAIRRTVKLIDRAFSNGQFEIQLCCFPHTLCTDGGLAIDQRSPGWGTTLTGVPRAIFLLWDKYFRPCGYELKAEVIDVDGAPDDVGMTLTWTLTWA